MTGLEAAAMLLLVLMVAEVTRPWRKRWEEKCAQWERNARRRMHERSASWWRLQAQKNPSIAASCEEYAREAEAKARSF